MKRRHTGTDVTLTVICMKGSVAQMVNFTLFRNKLT